MYKIKVMHKDDQKPLNTENKPFSPACERNKEPILTVLKKVITPKIKSVLEMGSGTGQHAAYFAPHFSHLNWTTSDVLEHHLGIRMWMSDSNVDNIVGPVEYQVGKDDFPKGSFDMVYTANTFHIMPWEKVEVFISQLPSNLKPNAHVLIYGPFNYNGQFTSESNERFDRNLRERASHQGIRNFEDVRDKMSEFNFRIENDYEMPANNRLIHFIKI
ncbi:MAG: class I SAM-dependent methyltransferase [Bdellovibrionales bacterium]|nr:class I SAM-dependent methyltransferase [Bdellovibrionales bacterium]